MPHKPSAPIDTNQTAMIGPNAAPMREVPSGCTANNKTRMTTAAGKT